MRLSSIACSMALAILQLTSTVRCLSVPVEAASPLPGHPLLSNETVSVGGFHWTSTVTCSKEGYPVKKTRIVEGIKYLRRIGRHPDLGPLDTSRVSCSYKSAIRWSNLYHDRHVVLNGFSDIANQAQKILDKCSRPDGFVTGTAWFWIDSETDGGWNVRVDYDRC